jgi:hypothetical protein
MIAGPARALGDGTRLEASAEGGRVRSAASPPTPDDEQAAIVAAVTATATRRIGVTTAIVTTY